MVATHAEEQESEEPGREVLAPGRGKPSEPVPPPSASEHSWAGKLRVLGAGLLLLCLLLLLWQKWFIKARNDCWAASIITAARGIQIFSSFPSSRMDLKYPSPHKAIFTCTFLASQQMAFIAPCQSLGLEISLTLGTSYCCTSLPFSEQGFLKIAVLYRCVRFWKGLFQDAPLTLADYFGVSGFLAGTVWDTQCFGCVLVVFLFLDLQRSLFCLSATQFLLFPTRGILGCVNWLKWSERARIGHWLVWG